MSSPPPSNPSTTTTTTSAAAGFFQSSARQKPLRHLQPAIFHTFHNPQPAATSAALPPPTQRQQPQQHSLHSNSRTHQQQSASGGVLYPVASSGKGFLSKHQQPNSDQNAAVGVMANSDGFPPRPASAYPYAVHRPYGFSNSDIPGQTLHQLVTPSSANLQQTLMGGGAVVPTVATGVSGSANPKVVAQSSVADDHGLKNLRDKSGDDNFVIIRDRKVQVSEGTSLYAQCRSWLKNGFTVESQPQYVDCVKSLPKPLPASMVEARKEEDTEIQEKMEDVEHLSAKELLQQHVKHAKKVRVRLRNQRLQRIERYKDRLALLLPPVVEQQPKNDPAS